MPTKKDLAALLSETPQPPLRRGRGLRLSRASKQALDLSLEAGARPEPSNQVAARPAQPATEATESGEAPIAPSAEASESHAEAAVPLDLAAPSDHEPLKPARDKRKLQLRKDLLKECKRIARAQDRKLYQVIESAIEDYIQRHGAHK
jgi:hypothetical protein